LPALAKAKAKGQGVLCMSNGKQMSLAWINYADDNNSKIVPNWDGGAARTNTSWVAGWLDLGVSSTDNTNIWNLKNALLGPYVGQSVGVYKCPADMSTSRHGGKVYPRVRSLSGNAYWGELAPSRNDTPYTAGYYQFKKITDMPSPSKTWLFIDEREDSMNDGWFAVDMSGYDPLNPKAYILVDMPASYHNKAGGLSFADNHAEIRRWVDYRTCPSLKKGSELTLGFACPNNKDVDWLQDRSTTKLKNATRF
jgi:hypothetical protein